MGINRERIAAELLGVAMRAEARDGVVRVAIEAAEFIGGPLAVVEGVVSGEHLDEHGEPLAGFEHTVAA